MKILYFSNEDVPGDHAGAIHIWEVARGLSRRGHRVTLVSAGEAGMSRGETREGVRILRGRPRVAGVKCNLRQAPLLAEVARERWDVVMERYLTLNGLGYLFASGRGLPYFVEVNGPHLEEITYRHNLRGAKLKILRWWVDRQFARADGACAPNVNIVRAGARHRARKILWGVDEGQFAGALAATGRARAWRREAGGEGRVVVLFVGSFRPWQGVADLPAIVAATAARVPDVLFWLVGDGPKRPAVEAGIKSLGVADAVRFLGWQRHAALPYIMAAADAAVAPFNDEYYPPLREFGFFWAPTKVLECLASGLAVVTSRYPVLDEMVEDGVSGFLVPAGDAGAFGAALARLASNAEVRREMGRRGERAVKERFGWRRHCEILEGFLEDAVAHRKKGLPRARI